jgi:hypothetical protein
MTLAAIATVILAAGAIALLAVRARRGDRSGTSTRALTLLLTVTLAGYALATLSLVAAGLAATIALAATLASDATHNGAPG